MVELAKRQRQILDYIQKFQQTEGIAPSVREIAGHFRLNSGTISGHLAALRKKGAVATQPGRFRSLRVLSPLQALRKPVVDIPVLGTIPAGRPEDRQQEAEGCISVDIGVLGLTKPSPLAFGLVVKGDSMIGKHIADGDIALIEPRIDHKPGDVVAARIDGEYTLKTFMMRGGKPYLRAENPRYHDLIPAEELVIEGTMTALIRKYR